jgi:imidazole glycerol-phosphate synthase subunit HisH
MTKRVSVVDYGAGNLLSVRRALEKQGAAVSLVTTPQEVASSDFLVLPGVGAFRDGMSGLERAGLNEAVRLFAGSGRPLLGICLGMQMLVSTSEEFGNHCGLGIIPGKVVPIPTAGVTGKQHKIPFIGWAQLQPHGMTGFSNTPLVSVQANAAVYLVHSYHVVPDDEADICATYDYDGVRVTAAINRENIFGAQFHPEKSGPVGLSILEQFLSL